MRYAFRCPKCALEFDVSRPVSDASKPAACPVDGSDAERIFTMPDTHFKGPRGVPPAPPARGGGGYSHHGHSHGFGTRAHTH